MDADGHTIPLGAIKKRARCDSNAQPSDSKSGDQNPQGANNQAVTQNDKIDLASCLALLTQKYPELQEIISAWPNLPDDVKQTIKTLIEKA